MKLFGYFVCVCGYEVDKVCVLVDNGRNIGITTLLNKIYTDLQIRQKKPTNKRQVLPVGESVFVVIEPIKKVINNYVGKSLIGKMKYPPSRQGKSIDVRLGKYGKGEGRISIKEAKEKFSEVRKASKEQGLDRRIILKNEKNKEIINYPKKLT